MALVKQGKGGGYCRGVIWCERKKLPPTPGPCAADSSSHVQRRPFTWPPSPNFSMVEVLCQVFHPHARRRKRKNQSLSPQSNWSRFKATGAASKQLEPLQSNWSRFKATGAASNQLEPLQSNWSHFKATGATSKQLEPLQNNRGTAFWVWGPLQRL